MKKQLLMVMAMTMALGLTGCRSQKVLTDSATIASPATVEEVTPVTTTTTTTTTRRVVPTVQAGDRSEKVTVVGDGQLSDYNVVVGSFGQRDNANNQKALMKDRGYQAFIVQNEAGMYRVVAGGYDTREAATAVRDKIRTTYASEAGTCAEAWLLIPAN